MLPQPTLSEARGRGWASLPTLTVSDAKRGAYHKRRVSDARNPQRIFDTLWMLVRSDLHFARLVGRTKALNGGALLRG